jgi:soluble lytic murein transglycosylase-like protein
MRTYFMTDRDLRDVNTRVMEYVDEVVPSKDDRRIVTAIVAIESAGNVAARSQAGAVGLMQITQPALDDYNDARGTAHRLEALAQSPSLNVRVGYYYLRMLETDHGLDRYDALRAYNVGLGTVRRDVSGEAGGVYAVKVLAYAQRLEEIGT